MAGVHRRLPEALQLADEVLNRFGRTGYADESLALALLVSGQALEALGRVEEAVASYLGVVSIYGTDAAVIRHVSTARDGALRLGAEPPHPAVVPAFGRPPRNGPWPARTGRGRALVAGAVAVAGVVGLVAVGAAHGRLAPDSAGKPLIPYRAAGFSLYQLQYAKEGAIAAPPANWGAFLSSLHID